MKSVRLTPFKAGEPLLAQLSADRLNAILTAIDATTPVAGDNIDIISTSGGKIIRSKASTAGSSSATTPFLVYQSSDSSVPPYPVLKLYPGKISTIVPTLAGVPLDQPADDPAQPWLYTPGNPFSIFLRCFLDLTDPQIQYRSYITRVEVVTDDDETVVPDLDETTGEIIEGRITWETDNDDPDLQVKGHFYLLVADVEGGTDGDSNITIGAITQWLFASYRTFVIAGDDAVVLI